MAITWQRRFAGEPVRIPKRSCTLTTWAPDRPRRAGSAPRQEYGQRRAPSEKHGWALGDRCQRNVDRFMKQREQQATQRRHLRRLLRRPRSERRLLVVHKAKPTTKPVMEEAAHQPAHATVHASCLSLQLAGGLRVQIEDHALLVPRHANHPLRCLTTSLQSGTGRAQDGHRRGD